MIAWAAYVSPVTSRASLRGDALSTLVYVANWRFIISGQGYFDHFGPQSPLLHTWSVAVEEQFYLVWPLLLLLVLRWRRRGVFTLAFVGATASASLDGGAVARRRQPRPAVLRHRHPRASAAARLRARGAAAPRRHRGVARPDPQGAPSRAPIRVLHPADRARRSGGPGVAAGCASRTAAPGSTAAASSSSPLPPAALLLSCTDAPRGPLARLLSLRAAALHRRHLLRAVPLPLAALPATHPRPHRGAAAAACSPCASRSTFAVAIVSYHLIEQPIRRGALSRARLRRWLPDRRREPRLLPVTSLLVVAGLITGLTLSHPGVRHARSLPPGGAPGADSRASSRRRRSRRS